MATENPKDEPQVLSYLAVRRFLGMLGLSLPLLLILYALLRGAMQTSISGFYHTHMGDVLVGILCAIGTFLVAYQGYPRKPGERLSDRWVSTIAGIAAIGVALFPTTAPEGACPPGERFSVQSEDEALLEYLCSVQGLIEYPAWLHVTSAAVFFGCLAIFCLFLFPKGHRHPDGRIDWTTAENRAYLVSGIALVASIVALVFYGLQAWREGSVSEALDAYYWVFFWEAVGVIAFAISWLIKGDTIQGLRSLLGRAKV
jgi:hypothetical protein